VTVLTIAWRAAGAPSRKDIAVAGICARCGNSAELSPARAVISKTFTGFEGWVDPSGHGLCPACCWAYSTDILRLSPHLVTANPEAMSRLTKAEVGEILQRGPLERGCALVVPLRPGRKHLMPTATWGRVTVEDAHLPWAAADARRLQVVARLRTLGFGTRMLASAAPAYPALRRLPAPDWPQVLSWWAELDPWRAADSPWLALALHVTVPADSKEPIS
jgi:hypothetical protein